MNIHAATQQTEADEEAILELQIEDIEKQIRRTGQTPKKNDALRYKLNDLVRQYKQLNDESPHQKLKYPKTNQPISFADALQMLQIGETVVPLQQDFSKSAFQFHDRDNQLSRVVTEVIAVNFAQRGTDNPHSFAMVPGGSGIGETRFGWEVAQLMSKSHFAGKVGENLECGDIVTEYVYIDFKNSECFTENFDSTEANSVRLGGRLAAKALLSKPFKGLAAKHPSCTFLRKCTAHQVLREIVARALKKVTEKQIVQLVLHMDEFQFFVDSFETPEKGRKALKDMLIQIRAFMAHGMPKTNSKPRFFIVPVLTGTAPYDLSFLTTHRINLVTIPLLPLTEESSLSMFSAAYTDKYTSELIAEIASQDHFLILLADTGYIPKYIVQLFDKDIKLSNKVPWSHYMEKIIVRKDKNVFGGSASAKVIIKLALSGQPVDSAFVLPCGKTVGDLERAGDLFLQRPRCDSERFHV